MRRAQGNFVMDTDLYACYLCVPVHLDLAMNTQEWQRLSKILQSLNESDVKVANQIGIKIDYVAHRAHTGGTGGARNIHHSTNDVNSPAQEEERRHRRFYAACILRELIEETPKEEVMQRYNLQSSMVADFQNNAARFAAKGKAFCERLGATSWTFIGAVLEKFSTRISLFAKTDILHLTAIKGVKTNTARLLFSAGLQDAEAVALADVKAIVKALETSAKYNGKSSEEAKAILRGKARQIKDAATRLLLRNEGGPTQKHSKAGGSEESPPVMKKVGYQGGRKSVDGGRGGGKKRDRETAEEQQPGIGIDAPQKKSRGDGASGSKDRPAAGAGAALRKSGKEQHDADGANPPEVDYGGYTEDWEAADAAAAELAAKQKAAAKAEAEMAAKKMKLQQEQKAKTQTKEQIERVSDEMQIPRDEPHPRTSNDRTAVRAVPASNPDKAANSAPCPAAEAPAKVAPRKISKAPPKGLFYLAHENRVTRFISILSELPRFAAEFVLVPQPNTVTHATVAAAAAAVLAPPAPRITIDKKGKKSTNVPLPASKRQRGQSAVAAATTIIVPMDLDLDGGTTNSGNGNGAGSSRAAQSGPKPGTVLGLAVSWGPGSAAYIPFHGQTDEFKTAAASQLASVMVRPEIEVVWFGWKDQVEATRWLISHAPNESLPNRRSPGGKEDPSKKEWRIGSGLSLGMVDARIAAWMCRPDKGDFRDGLTTEIDLFDVFIPKKSGGPKKKVHGPEFLLEEMTKDATAATVVCQGLDKNKDMSSRAIAACRKAALTFALYEAASKELVSHGDPALMSALGDREMALVPVLADMQEAGVGYDLTKLQKLIPRITRRISEIESLAYKSLGGHRFQLSSAKDINEVIYERLRLPPPPTAEIVHKQKDGSTRISYSTKKDCLEALAEKHPVVPIILEHRRLSHTLSRAKDMLSTALVAKQWSGLVSEGSREVVKVNGCFFQTTAATGRLSMGEPNLQNLHRPFPTIVTASQKDTNTSNVGECDDDDVVMTQHGVHMELDVNIRAAIVPVRSGRVILSADFRQIEFRMMAHFSGDADLRAMFTDGAEDPFKILASKWRKIPIANVTSELRNHTKQICYAVIYGMGAARMAEDMKITAKKAEKLKSEFLETYSGLKRWIEGVKMDCAEKQFITTLAGRRRWLPHIKSENWSLKSKAEREAVNSVCQGSAADVAKMSMIMIWRRMIDEELSSHAAMVLQIHDELLFDVEESYVDRVAGIVVDCMEGAAPEVEVPLRARLSVGRSWGELKPYELARDSGINNSIDIVPK